MKTIKTILVDDEPRGLSALQRLLEFNCPEIEIIGLCSSADEAKEKITLLKPELVFLDIAMPEKNGFDLLNAFDRRYDVTGFPDPAGSGAIYRYPAAGRVLVIGLESR